MTKNDHILQLLEAKLGKGFRSNNDYVFNCPYCISRVGKVDRDHHLYVNINLKLGKDSGWYNCFRCGSSGPLKFMLGSVLYVGDSYVPLKKQVLDIMDGQTSDSVVSVPTVDLPDDFCTMDTTTVAYRYCVSRGITDDDIKHYNIGFGSNGLCGRIIIPNIDMNGNVDYWVARSYVNHKNKYKNCLSSSRDKMFNFSRCIKYKYDTVVITEGVISAIRAGRNAIATYGKKITREKLSMLVNAPFKNYVLAFDADTYKRKERKGYTLCTKSETFNLANFLYTNGKEVKFIEYDSIEDDPASIDFNGKLKQAKVFNFSSIDMLL